ncbi:hypothetical protein [Streptomyces sp. NPDC048638]|uniref:hypothetical protein n=1 Tax=Streptomyces sp. NPDC048638 TaxID=3365580 RepID=UPI003713C637
MWRVARTFLTIGRSEHDLWQVADIHHCTEARIVGYHDTYRWEERRTAWEAAAPRRTAGARPE